MIYFIQDEATGLIKIGRSVRPIEERIKELQTGCPGKLTMLATIEEDESSERELHEVFAEDRVGGEWFRPSSYLLRTMAHLAWECGWMQGWNRGREFYDQPPPPCQIVAERIIEIGA
jgi:hypothetical protein